jgi:hypothetical protein
MPGALEWVWGTLKPLYKGSAIVKAELVHQNLNLPRVPRLSRDVLTAAGLDDAALASIFAILDSYQHTNALALVCFSALLARFEGSARRPDLSSAPQRNEVVPIRRVALPRLVPIGEMPPATARLVHELNGFGEDADFALVASMYRHLSYGPRIPCVDKDAAGAASRIRGTDVPRCRSPHPRMGVWTGFGFSYPADLPAPRSRARPGSGSTVRPASDRPYDRSLFASSSSDGRVREPARPGLNGLGSSGGGSTA